MDIKATVLMFFIMQWNLRSGSNVTKKG